MVYRVELTARASRDLRHIYQSIDAKDSLQAYLWFNELEAAILSLDNHPTRGPIIPENKKLRHLLYGNKPHIYRIIYRINERSRRVNILHIRHGAREMETAFTPRTA